MNERSALIGVSGSIEPTWPPKNAPAGKITEDGSVVWVLVNLRESSI